MRPFPAVDTGKWRISMNGGGFPVWSSDGRELFYREARSALPPTSGRDVPTIGPTGLMVAAIQAAGASFSFSRPQLLFEGEYVQLGGRWGAVTPDGKRFLMMKAVADSESQAAPTSLVVVQHWLEELKRLVPTP